MPSDQSSDHAPLMPAALDALALEVEAGVTDYPEPFRGRVAGRRRARLGDRFGLTSFGVNLTRLDPGGQSALRHWHTRQDEFVYVVEGEVTLVTDAGEQILRAGMCVGFPAGRPDGHQLLNRSGAPAAYLEMGDRTEGDDCHYPDEDLVFRGERYLHRDGTPW